ncbi:hypothetical protein JOC37_001278 [Desulfohalotomaculum tongense]|nr:FeoB-associated Cys-rich membrane protein [Desulforadius tongensis]MBM7854898.1 hypothetical protein [Desulforadius tongensis]
METIILLVTAVSAGILIIYQIRKSARGSGCGGGCEGCSCNIDNEKCSS